MKIASVAAALYLAFVVARLAVFGWDPSAFVVAGDGITDVTDAPPHLGVHLGTDGYDGQAYYRLARDPLTREVTADGIVWTRPAYWQARIGYPLVVWAVSVGGQEPLVPAAMLLVNLLAVAALAALGAALARDLGRSPWWALVPALWAGFLVGVGQDLTEPLAGALVLASLLALRRERWLLAAGTLTAATLTRETAIILAAAVGAAAVLPGLRQRLGSAVGSAPAPPWWVAAVPAVVSLGWRTWVRHRWSDLVPHADDDLPLGLPFVELGRYVGRAATDLGASWDNLVLLAPALLAVALVASAVADRGGGLPHERLALTAYVGLLACLAVWDRGQAYLRWCDEPLLLGWVCLLARPTLRLRLLAGTVAVLWLATGVATFTYPGTDRWQPPAAVEGGVVR